MTKNMHWADAIITVMGQAPEPMTYVEIADAIMEQDLRDSYGATPANTVYMVLSTRLGDRVEKVSRSTFRLKSAVDDADARGGASAAVGAPQQSPGTAVPADGKGQESAGDTAGSADDDVVGQETTGLVTSFGMYWLRSEIDWKRTAPALLGTFSAKAKPVDFCWQQGVYILYDGSRPIYAGRVQAGRLGQRMREHTRDRHATRWDRFSWFGLRPVEDDGTLGDVEDRAYTKDDVIAAFEAILIEALETPLNRRAGDWGDAQEYTQVVEPALRDRKKLVGALNELLGELDNRS